MPRQPIPIQRRILARVESRVINPALLDPCWLWLGARHKSGYGILSTTHGHFDYTHRLAYAEFVGPIPDGYDVHHACRVQTCCQPAHLWALPHDEHTRLHDHLGVLA